jgi:hypothetical protein
VQGKSSQYYIFWVCVCSLNYSACKALAPYCHLWPAWLYSIFPHYLINCTILGNKIFRTCNVFWFCLQLLFEMFLILRRNERDIIKNIYWSSCKVLVLLYWKFNFLDFYKHSISTLDLSPTWCTKFLFIHI